MRKGNLSIAFVIWLLSVMACGSTVNDLPVYTCPTQIPPTATLPPPIVISTATPWGWFPTATPIQLPTLLPTPYIITPPQDFYVGDAIFVGSLASPFYLRFRLQNVQTFPHVYTWQIEVKNLGVQDYELFPALQSYVSAVENGGVVQVGQWGSTQAAADEAGLLVDNELYTLSSGEIRVFQLAAFAPPGTPQKFAYVLAENNIITWVNSQNPFCSGDIAG